MYTMRENEIRATWHGAINLGTEFGTGYLITRGTTDAKEVRQYYADPETRALHEAPGAAARAELAKDVLAIIGEHCRALTCETNTHQMEGSKLVRAYIYTVYVTGNLADLEEMLAAAGYEVVRLADGTSARCILKDGDAIRMRKYED